MTQSYVQKKYGHGTKYSEGIQEFIGLYLQPFVETSRMLEQRRLIRESKYLNKLLYDNLHALKYIFKRAKRSSIFTMDCAKKMLMPLKHPDYKMSFLKVEECFIFCMMTVIDEVGNMKKYEYLSFVEFLDFLCRIAIVGIIAEDLIEYKVQSLLQMVFTASYKDGSMNEKDYAFRVVDEKYSFE